MDISTLMSTDMILNIIGYLAAGALAVVVQSAFRRRPSVASAEVDADIATEIAPLKKSKSPRSENERKSVKFVSFGENAEVRRETQEPPSPQTPSVNSRRNRADIIRIARTMLNAGASNENIRSVLPISEAELSLLSATRN